MATMEGSETSVLGRGAVVLWYLPCASRCLCSTFVIVVQAAQDRQAAYLWISSTPGSTGG